MSTMKIDPVHVTMVEIENETSRWWVGPFYTPGQHADGIEEARTMGYWISDMDCSIDCWCVGGIQ